MKDIKTQLAELEEKHENECRQISAYQAESHDWEKKHINEIVAAFPFEQQREIFVEECAEAIKAVQKLKRKDNSDFSGAVENLIEEVADVLVTADQMRLYLGAEKVDAVIRKKLLRQVERIRKECAE